METSGTLALFQRTPDVRALGDDLIPLAAMSSVAYGGKGGSRETSDGPGSNGSACTRVGNVRRAQILDLW